MRHTLADVLPSVAAAFAEAEARRSAATPVGANLIGVSPARDVVVLIVDGLGAELLARHADIAPTLAAHTRQRLAAGFPATTATSLSSLAMGAPCATHGIIGYSFAIPGEGGPENFNALRWRVGDAEGADARDSHPPEQMQQVTSTVEQLAAAGIEVHYVVPAYQVRSGLTRASFRAPGRLHAADSLETVRDGILEVARHEDAGRRFAYAYYPDLDMNGHLHGPESPEWLAVLAGLETMVADLFTDLPDTCTLLITGDHGMIRAGAAVDLEADPDLTRDVRLVSGEARVRHVYTAAAEAADEVADRWAAVLAGHAQVVTRRQALDEHWFGATPPVPVIEQRIGDVIAVARGTSILVCPTREPRESAMVGHHGAWTDAEQLIPLVSNR